MSTFGSHIAKVAAMIIGMYPDCDLKKVESIGNEARDGARIALPGDHVKLKRSELQKV